MNDKSELAKARLDEAKWIDEHLVRITGPGELGFHEAEWDSHLAQLEREVKETNDQPAHPDAETPAKVAAGD